MKIRLILAGLAFAMLAEVVFLVYEVQGVKVKQEAMQGGLIAVQERLDETRDRIADLQAKLETVENAFRELVISIASQKTGCPAWVLRGIMFAESSYGKNLEHPDPWDTGPFGIHERPSYHAERARKWGEYDPRNLLDAAIIAGRIVMENQERLGTLEEGISAYRRGVSGTRENGIDQEYLAMVQQGGRIEY